MLWSFVPNEEQKIMLSSSKEYFLLLFLSEEYLAGIDPTGIDVER